MNKSRKLVEFKEKNYSQIKKKATKPNSFMNRIRNILQINTKFHR